MTPVYVRLHISTHPAGGGVAFVSILQHKTNVLGGRKNVVVASHYESVYGGDPDWLKEAQRTAADVADVLGVELVTEDERAKGLKNEEGPLPVKGAGGLGGTGSDGRARLTRRR